MKGQSLGGHILIPEPMLPSAPIILPPLQRDRPLFTSQEWEQQNRAVLALLLWDSLHLLPVAGSQGRRHITSSFTEQTLSPVTPGQMLGTWVLTGPPLYLPVTLSLQGMSLFL